MKQFWKTNEKRICLTIGGILAFFRIAMLLRTPIYAIANAIYDDQLLAKLAEHLLQGEWLGPYNSVTLVKGISFSVFLAMANRLGIPYLLAEGTAYIVAVILFLYALRKVLKNQWIRLAAFGFLLYSPSMLSTFTEQRVYNMALIPTAILLVAAGCIGMFYSCSEQKKEFYGWTILEVISFVFFWHLRNESIWYLPFVMAACGCSAFCIAVNFGRRKKTVLRCICCLLPFVGIYASNEIIAQINENHYGVHLVNDRSEGAEAELMTLLLSIDEEKSIAAMGEDYTYKSMNKHYSKNVWIPREVIELAMENSPTFETIHKYVSELYEGKWNSMSTSVNAVMGDSFIWAIREAMLNAGYYHENAVETEAFYQSVVDELEEAFEQGRLVKDDKIHLSALSRGISKDDIPEIVEGVKAAFGSLITEEYTYVGLRDADGNIEEVRYFEALTGALAEYGYTLGIQDSEMSFGNLVVQRSNKIIRIYQKTGTLRFVGSIIAFLILTVILVKRIKEKKFFLIGEWLITLGMLGTLLLFTSAVVTFSSFLGTVFVYYHYLTPGLVLIDIIETLMLFGGLDQLIRFWLNKRHTDHK
ncbi:MAG: hypothetical protein Q4B47_03395 [Eubacteriales bacterium]|nr:hypothetical protein [Eubacteriales bacterium]